MRALLAITLLTLGLTAQSEQFIETGDTVIHYNALSTESVPPQVATANGITRSKNQGMINITVLAKGPGDATTPTEATVTVSARNLTGQQRSIDVRLIEEADARYYIGTFRVANEEQLTFEVSVEREGKDPIEFSFSQRFYAS